MRRRRRCRIARAEADGAQDSSRSASGSMPSPGSATSALHARHDADHRPGAEATKGLWFSFGHAHHGLTLGPVTGRIIAEQMTGETPLLPLEPFSASRFLN
jgi:glycine/D-amino acid oxidase-like deaminating enzyme